MSENLSLKSHCCEFAQGTSQLSILSQGQVPQVQRRELYTLSTHRALFHTVPAKGKKPSFLPREPLEDSLTSPALVGSPASSGPCPTSSYSSSHSREQAVPVLFYFCIHITFNLFDWHTTHTTCTYL